MEKKFLQNCTKSFLRMIVVCAMLFYGTDQLRGEGTNPLSPTANDSVFLAVVNATMFPQQSFYQFASYDGPEYSRLNIKIVDHNIENIYIGLSPEVDGDGLLSGNTGNFWMRIKDPTGTVVHGPFLIDTTNANAKTFALANAGPDVVAGMSGYSTAAAFASFNPTMNGDYYVEISESMVAPAGGTINIQWFDSSFECQVGK